MNSQNKDKKPTNFIRNIINEDLSNGKHNSIKTRFPPEPNGYLHIGHAKSICLNFGTAEDYDGYCNLRFDDTNPAKEDIEYVNSIKEDIRWLGFNWNGKVKYSSSYFDIFYKCAEELISKGLAYVCFLSIDQTRDYRGTLKSPGKNSPYRDKSVKDNLILFNKMKEGKFLEGECVLRAKIACLLVLCVCVIQLFTVFALKLTTRQMMIGAFIQCTILRIALVMLLKE